MKKIIFTVATCAASVLGLLSITSVAHAETIISQDIVGDVKWTKENSPYIISKITNVTKGSTLTIGPGTTIKGFYGWPIVVTDANLHILGTKDDRVTIDGLDSIHSLRSKVDIAHTDFHTSATGLDESSSIVDIASSTFSNPSSASIHAIGGTINIVGSRFENNWVGIALGNNMFEQNIAYVTVTNSIFKNNALAAIRDLSPSTVVAKGNWWGNIDGPPATSTNMVSKSVCILLGLQRSHY